MMTKQALNAQDVRDLTIIVQDLRYYAHTPARRRDLGAIIDRLASKAEDLDGALRLAWEREKTEAE